MLTFEPSEAALTSPGRALSERQRLETTLTRRADIFMVQFLSETRQHILRHDEVQPLAIQELFTSAVKDLTRSLKAPPETQQIIQDHFAYSAFPSIVHDTAEYLFSEARQEQLTSDQLATILEAGLDYDQPSFENEATPTNSLEASAAPRAIGQFLARTIGRGKRWKYHTQETARTATTNALNEAQLRVLQRSPFTHKQWITRRDDSVRETHAEIDGQIVPKASLFQVGAASLLYPGQGTFPPEEVINCRCVIIGVYADGQTR